MNKKLITLFSVFTFIFIAVFSILSFNKAYSADMGLNKTSLSLHTGENYILKVKNLSKTHSTIWSVKNKKTASVSNKGKVTGLSEGNTEVYVKIYDKNKRLKATLTATVSVDSLTLKYASTGKELKKALSTKNADIVVLNPAKDTSFSIPDGNFNVALHVISKNKININIESGTFVKTAVIGRAGKQTTFNIKGTLAELYVNAKGSETVVQTHGKSGELTSLYLNAPSSLSFTANGEGGDTAVYATAKSDISVKGNTSKNVTLSLWKDAADSVITAFKKIILYADTSLSVILKENAGVSEITTLNYTVPVEIKNNTDKTVEITTPSGIKTVEAGKVGTVSGKKAS